MVKKQTISKMIALHLKSIGVQSIFGVPGGGSSLDLIDAAESVGIKFYLVKREEAVTNERTKKKERKEEATMLYFYI